MNKNTILNEKIQTPIEQGLWRGKKKPLDRQLNETTCLVKTLIRIWSPHYSTSKLICPYSWREHNDEMTELYTYSKTIEHVQSFKKQSTRRYLYLSIHLTGDLQNILKQICVIDDVNHLQ